MAILLVSEAACVQQQTNPTNPIGRAKYESVVQSLSLSGVNQASVINERTHDLRITSDGGKNWQFIPAASVGGAFECAFMLNENWGWAVNRKGQVFNTHSAGQSWIQISQISDFTGAHQIEFLNERDGWLREFLGLWRTRDGGSTWEKTLSTLTPGIDGQPSSMFVLASDTVVASGSSGQVYTTVDGGDNWKIRTVIEGNVNLEDLWFVDRTHGWLTGYTVLVAGEKLRPLLLETNDGGDNWKELPVEADLLPSSVCAVGKELWLAGSRRIANRQNQDSSGVLLRSSDGGNHWREVNFGIDEPVVKQIRFADHEHGWLDATDGLYRTEDGGRTWFRVLNWQNQGQLPG